MVNRESSRISEMRRQFPTVPADALLEVDSPKSGPGFASPAKVFATIAGSVPQSGNYVLGVVNGTLSWIEIPPNGLLFDVASNSQYIPIL